MAPPIFLIGYRGTGKTTVARLLAEELDAVAVDSDQIIEQEFGCTIAEMFASAGESAFREREVATIAQLCGRDNIVASLGGGAILNKSTRERISETGLVIWLTASPDVLGCRLSADDVTLAQRPSLTGQGVVAEIAGVLAERTPLYEEVADITISTDRLSPSEVVGAILDALDDELDEDD